MIKKHNGQWEVLLADLALILFITSLGGLVSMPIAKDAQDTALPETETLDIAPSQALYRSVTGGPNLAEWLKSQPRDPRATLTIFVEYQSDDAGTQLAQAAQMIEQAKYEGVSVRTVISSANRSDIYASLAYDAAK